MARGQKLVCVSFLKLPDGSKVPLSELSAEEMQNFRERAAENVGRALGDYLSAHPEEIEPLSRCAGVTVVREAGT